MGGKVEAIVANIPEETKAAVLEIGDLLEKAGEALEELVGLIPDGVKAKLAGILEQVKEAVKAEIVSQLPEAAVEKLKEIEPLVEQIAQKLNEIPEEAKLEIVANVKKNLKKLKGILPTLI